MGGSTGTHNISCHWKVYPISTSQSTSLHYFFSCAKLVQQGTCASLSHKEHHPLIYIYIYIYYMYVSRNNVANQNTIWYNMKSLGLSFSTLLVSWYFQCLWSLSIFHTYPLVLSYMDLASSTVSISISPHSWFKQWFYYHLLLIFAVAHHLSAYMFPSQIYIADDTLAWWPCKAECLALVLIAAPTILGIWPLVARRVVFLTSKITYLLFLKPHL
jgi:hypothetical protein